MRNKLALLLVLEVCCFAQTASYPSALATSQNLKVGVNGVSTLLTADTTSSATTLTISNCAGIVPYTLVTLDQEIMNVTGCSGTTLLVDTRGFDNTVAVAHVAGTVIYANIDAWHHNSLSAEVQAIEAALGTNASNVPVFAATEVGSNNAIQVNAAANLPPIRVGLVVYVLLAHTLQAGPNTFTYTISSALPIVSHFNTANNIATGYTTGIICLVFDGSHWEDLSQ